MSNTKYNSKKITVDGYTFDSMDESKYYQALLIRKAKGEIVNFEMQPKFTLIPGFKKQGKTFKAMTYTPDFLIYHNDGSEELIDVKGFSTQQGELRYKLFNYFYQDKKLTWVARNLKYGDKYGFIDYFELKKVRSKNKKAKEA
ncbi:DUF1064 domain-containing protein [Clostridium beijerinckii]|uniref:DUF1064 domain-containing protein n=2 Tax=Clostridium beijerinckii TaxID=1520 RepID=UPI001361ADE3|nr:DUF1064 domain-containing protein [Clostridium beijerinckii]MZK54157.1 DUF1064 domain-containing protein [Clostridium beijerinckii]MZK62246.1 DUF1064 domain-containing protein [Clostridium beijerinckii]MZK62253.1 DUF1064 domain-containing protein [Clostridium beijerinckii]MZK72459.1 DUF1064 domain-containing protein [Clostridium beijerinckii]MZK77831.1 DUF1064 domain-containing protein [Clostridium beijerinckii]